MATNSNWQRTEEMAKKHDQGSSTWLKLGNDGDKAVIVFLGEPIKANTTGCQLLFVAMGHVSFWLGSRRYTAKSGVPSEASPASSM